MRHKEEFTGLCLAFTFPLREKSNRQAAGGAAHQPPCPGELLLSKPLERAPISIRWSTGASQK